MNPLKIVLMAMCVVTFGAFGVQSASASNLGNSWDFGDISGAYWTSSETSTDYAGTFTWTQLGSNINCQHKIDSVNATFSPRYTYTYDDHGNYVGKTQNGYQVEERISGYISSSLTAADLPLNQYQQSQFNARGLYLSEFTGLFGYNSSGDVNAPDIREQGDVNIALRNFVVDYAYSNYNEYDWSYGGGKGIVVAGSGDNDPITYFDYNVTWYGDFTPGTLANSFMAPAMMTSVPEPATMALLAAGFVGLIVRRKKQS